MSVADIIRSGRRREPEPAAPPARNLRREYVDAVAAFVQAKRSNNAYAAVVAAQRLRELRQEAEAEGHGEAMARVWTEPEPHADDRWLQWYGARIEHILHGGADPGPRPHQQNEWAYWAQLYKERCDALTDAYRTGTPGAIADAEGNFWNVSKQAAEFGGFFAEVCRHFMPVPARRGEDWIGRWHTEAMHRLQHGAPSGGYVEEPPKEPFVRRLVDIVAADYSFVVLLIEHAGHPVGARVRLDPGVSHQLVEAGQATWCDPAKIPNDPRPPAETAPGEDWVALHFLKTARLRSRHQVGPGVVRPVPPGEAQQLVGNGIAEVYVLPPPPPPPPPKPLVLFE